MTTTTAVTKKLKPYSAYKDSGIHWLKEIPAHWDHLKIKYSTYVKGRIGWQNLRTDEFTDEGPFCVTGTDFDSGRVDWTRCYHVSNSRYEQDRFIQLRAGDLLITKDGSIGKLALVTGLPGPACLNSGILVTRPLTDQYCSEYLYWVLSSGVFTAFIDYVSAGSTIQHLYQYVFETFTLPTPTLKEQHTIAGFLDRETAKIDALVAKKERLIELLQEKRAALITHAVTKGLPSTRSGQATSTVPMKVSGVDWLGHVPGHWEVKRIKFIAQVGNGSTPSRENAEYWGGEYPWLNSGVVNLREVTEASDFVTDLALTECHLPRVHPPAVLVGITGEGKTRGMATVLRIEATINQHLAFIRPTRADCDPEYIRYVLHAAYQFLRDESGGGGSTKGALTCDQLGNVSIPFPPDPEQSAIAAFLDRETVKLDALIAKVREGIEKLKEYRTALISAAVTGKIDVREPLTESGHVNVTSEQVSAAT